MYHFFTRPRAYFNDFGLIYFILFVQVVTPKEVAYIYIPQPQRAVTDLCVFLPARCWGCCVRVSYCVAEAEILPTSFLLQEAPMHRCVGALPDFTCVSGESMEIIYYHTNLNSLITLSYTLYLFLFFPKKLLAKFFNGQ